MNVSLKPDTAHVIVRAREVSDLDAITSLMNCPGARHGTLQTPYRSNATVGSWLEKMPANTLGLCAEAGARVVGMIDVLPRMHRMAHCAGIGIAVHDDYVGRGVGTALLAAAVECADTLLGLRRLELTVFVDNYRAIALYQRFGFVEEGRSPAFAMRDGKLVDAFHMARFADAPVFASPVALAPNPHA
ncbi:GNAT family N-acetyltransferase [Paraburkholderia fynbosensis]|uniref:L-amino acid N-acetyltransferase AaaT n=1 Tax=Paraburkholderia fynbosensis TaxID=1200993 RepID=A0A6J5H1W7_9BURK|nr:GNAT family N-acetyltransferase [Paraburkholderia fynbosensis]CAB3809166.1 L-amino acid N-acetyltransferase AaaT [Paraburkholderia fynbosensis]